jgi:hypothetical protein
VQQPFKYPKSHVKPQPQKGLKRRQAPKGAHLSLPKLSVAIAIIPSFRSDAVSPLSSHLQFCFRIPFTYIRISPTSFPFSEILKSLTCVVVKQRFVVVPQLYYSIMLMLHNPRLCLRHSAFACRRRNFGRERGTASMSQWMSAFFLGTSSGGGPSESRNCSSLVLDIVGDGSLWSTHSPHAQIAIDRLTSNLVVDGAEGTVRQFSLQPEGGRSFHVAKVNKIFITHMHGESFNHVAMPRPHNQSQRTTSWASPLFYATSLASLIQKRSLRVAHPYVPPPHI